MDSATTPKSEQRCPTIDPSVFSHILPRHPDRTRDTKFKTMASPLPRDIVALQRETFKEKRPKSNVQRETFKEKRSKRNVQRETFKEKRSKRNVQRETFKEKRSKRNVQRETFKEKRSKRNVQRETSSFLRNKPAVQNKQRNKQTHPPSRTAVENKSIPRLTGQKQQQQQQLQTT